MCARCLRGYTPAAQKHLINTSDPPSLGLSPSLGLEAKKSSETAAFFVFHIRLFGDELGLVRCSGDLLRHPGGVLQLLAAFPGQGIAVSILEHAVEVQVGDAFAHTRLTHAQFLVCFDAFPKISLQNSQANVVVLFLFVVRNDVQNHVVVLVQSIHGMGVFWVSNETPENYFQAEFGGGNRPKRYERIVNDC